MALTPTIVFSVKQLSQSGNWQWLATSQEDLNLVIASGLVKTKDRALKAIKNCLTLFGATAYIAIEIENHKGKRMRYEMTAQMVIESPRFSLAALPKS